MQSRIYGFESQRCRESHGKCKFVVRNPRTQTGRFRANLKWIWKMKEKSCWSTEVCGFGIKSTTDSCSCGRGIRTQRQYFSDWSRIWMKISIHDIWNYQLIKINFHLCSYHLIKINFHLSDVGCVRGVESVQRALVIFCFVQPTTGLTERRAGMNVSNFQRIWFKISKMFTGWRYNKGQGLRTKKKYGRSNVLVEFE